MVLSSDSLALIRSSFCVEMKTWRSFISSYASIAIGFIGPIFSSRVFIFSTRDLISSSVRLSISSLSNLLTSFISTLNSTDNRSFTEFSCNLLSLSLFCHSIRMWSADSRIRWTSRMAFSSLSMMPLTS